MRKRRISKETEARLRVIYAIDLATRWGRAQSTMNALFEEGLNPAWMRPKDVFREKDFKDIKDRVKQGYGCFKVRETKKSYIIYMDIARISKR